ncbi:MAG TPA: HNH endonuclease [Acidimicrobiales bacterium]|nr:HNH endonuclease [Acidimicrobiales bacterium]
MLKSQRCDDCCQRAAEFNGHWKGGRARHHQGYVMIFAPWHPRTMSKRYVFEHVLVMEDALGRRLYPGETVHHRNGVRDDNRLENLELWVRPQPAGIRASDALEWAKTIIARYGVPGDD